MKTTNKHITQAARMQVNLVKSSLIIVAGALALMIITMAIGEGVSSFFGGIAFLVGLVLFPMAIGFTQVLSSIIIWIKSTHGGIVFFKWHLILSIIYLTGLSVIPSLNYSNAIRRWFETDFGLWIAFGIPAILAFSFWITLYQNQR